MTRQRNSSDKQERLTQTAAAKKLGVSREHLNRVLLGHRSSKSLLRKYNRLIASRRQTPLTECEFSPGDEFISGIAFVLGTNPDYLVGVLEGLEPDEPLLERFRLFARFTRDPQAALGMIQPSSEDFPVTPETKTAQQQPEQISHNEKRDS